MTALAEKRKMAIKRARIAEEASVAERIRAERCVIRNITEYFHGVQVPDGFDLFSKHYVDMCVDTKISDAVDMAYKAMKTQGRLQGTCGDGTMGEDIRLVVGLLKNIRAKCVPQEFSAGILLMHLEILEGLKF